MDADEIVEEEVPETPEEEVDSTPIVQEGDDEEIEPEDADAETKPYDLSAFSRREQEMFVATFPEVEVTGLLADEDEEEAAPVVEPEKEVPAEAAPEEESPADEPFVPTPGTVLTGKKEGDKVYGSWSFKTFDGVPAISDGVNAFAIEADGKPSISFAWLKELRESDPTEYLVVHSAFKEAEAAYERTQGLMNQQATEASRQVEERSARLEESIQKVAPELKKYIQGQYEGNPHAEAIADNVVALYPQLLKNFIADNVDAVAKAEGVSKSQAEKMIRADLPANIHAQIIADAEKQSLKLALSNKLPAKAAATATDRVVPPTKTGGRVVSTGSVPKVAVSTMPAQYRIKMERMNFTPDEIADAWKSSQNPQ